MVKNIQYLSQKYGGISRFYILSQRYFLISDVKFIEAIMSSTEFLSKGKSYDFLHPWLGQGLLTSTGRRWKNHRKFLTPAFHFNILQNFLPVFVKSGKILTEKLRSYAAQGEPVDLFPIIALTALDNVTESIMGVSVGAQNDSESQYVKAIKDLTNVLAYRMRNAFASSDPIFNLMSMKRVQDRALKVLHDQSIKVIEARRRQLDNMENSSPISEYGIKNKHAFLDLLLLAEIDGEKIDNVSVREEVDTFMFEGHDTTTSGIVFSLFCIANNKEVQEKILQEQISVLGNDMSNDPTYSDIQQMKYLECVIKESLRLYPSVPFIERQISQDTGNTSSF
ncbi:cytochrome P450 4d2-like [Hyposmocoma kahamanoa]|uniref:cytochrome P450 4d2-like n=1 Tax=Hyposmocoma kahamanoa TaxID=1477025 RepID=UPI000E6DA2CF|nr:cytochrome P450 4d2-like [Hyposmocoma kahamanoa]